MSGLKFALSNVTLFLPDNLICLGFAKKIIFRLLYTYRYNIYDICNTKRELTKDYMCFFYQFSDFHVFDDDDDDDDELFLWYD